MWESIWCCCYLSKPHFATKCPPAWILLCSLISLHGSLRKPEKSHIKYLLLLIVNCLFLAPSTPRSSFSFPHPPHTSRRGSRQRGYSTEPPSQRYRPITSGSHLTVTLINDSCVRAPQPVSSLHCCSSLPLCCCRRHRSFTSYNDWTNSESSH